MSAITVSVIVASHRQAFIDDCARALLLAVKDTVLAEIIIVADYPVDTYRSQFPEIKWLYVPDNSIPVKRNRGIQRAQGEICAFIDDDCKPTGRWLSEAVRFLGAHRDVAGVEGLTMIEACEQRKGAYREFKRLEKRGYRTNNIFYRRAVLKEVTMFDERFAFQREDVDLAYTILEAGYEIGYSKEITVLHRFRKNEKWDLLKNCVNRRFDPLLYKKHRKMYRRYIGTPFTPGIGLILIMYLLSIVGVVFSPKLTGPILVINALVILFFTARRGGWPTLSGLFQWLREGVSFVVSPCVLIGALLYGSFRYRQLLLV